MPTTSLRLPAAAGCVCCVLAPALLRLRFAGGQFALAGNRFHPRDILAQASNLFQALGLAHVELKLQLKELIVKIALLVAEFLIGQVADFFRFHKLFHFSVRRRFALHEAGAQRQFVRSQPHGFRSILRRDTFHLKQDLPGRTTATQWSGAPLPFPIRVSAGFLVTGLSGNRRIQILPPRLTNRVIATRLPRSAGR